MPGGGNSEFWRAWFGALEAEAPSGEEDRAERDAALRESVDAAAKHAVRLGWDLSSFCELAAETFERNGGRVG